MIEPGVTTELRARSAAHQDTQQRRRKIAIGVVALVVAVAIVLAVRLVG